MFFDMTYPDIFILIALFHPEKLAILYSVLPESNEHLSILIVVTPRSKLLSHFDISSSIWPLR